MILTGLIAGPASILAQPAQSLQQPGVLGLQLFNQTLSGALVHNSLVLDALCPVLVVQGVCISCGMLLQYLF